MKSNFLMHTESTWQSFDVPLRSTWKICFELFSFQIFRNLIQMWLWINKSSKSSAAAWIRNEGGEDWAPNHRIPSQEPFDGRFGTGHDSDRFCKERVVCKSERRGTSGCEVQELLVCPQVWPDTRHRLAQLQCVPLYCLSWSFELFMPSQHENMDRSLETKHWNKISKF